MDGVDGNSEARRLARVARDELAPLLAFLQQDITPAPLQRATPAVAQAMEHLHCFQLEPTPELVSAALSSLRSALQALQTAPHPELHEGMTRVVAQCLGRAHSIAELTPARLTELGDTTLLDKTRKSPGQRQVPLARRGRRERRALVSDATTNLEGDPERLDALPTLNDPAFGARVAHPLAQSVQGDSPGHSARQRPAGAGEATLASDRGEPIARVAASLGVHSESNFYSGLAGGDVMDSGGLFIATYTPYEVGQPLLVLVQLPGGLSFQAWGVVRWRRQPAADDNDSRSSAPGCGVRFSRFSAEARELVARYTRNRQPLFHQDD